MEDLKSAFDQASGSLGRKAIHLLKIPTTIPATQTNNAPPDGIGR